MIYFCIFLNKVLNSTEINQHGVSTLHTSHCSPNGEILISTLGKPNGDAMGEILRIDAETLEVKGTWSTGTKKAAFGYDFWYQPYHDVLVATEWAIPRIFKRGYVTTDSHDPGKLYFFFIIHVHAYTRTHLCVINAYHVNIL